MMSCHLPLSLVLALVLRCSVRMCPASNSNITDTDLIDLVFEGYDSRLPPTYVHGGQNTRSDIHVNIYIVSVYDVSEIAMHFSLSMFLRERWVEPRLAYSRMTNNITRLELDIATQRKIWIPDLYILNEKSAKFHEVTVPNQMIHVYPDGTVQFSMRVTGTFTCAMDLRKYPFDTQLCKLEFESYGHSTETIKFLWRSDAVTVARNIELPQFTIEKYSPYNCDNDYYGIVYPCIGLSIVIRRNYGYYITQIYVPSLLIVILSWVNFWLDCEAVPARISLGLLTVLTMVTQSSGSKSNLPRVSYIKAIDVWMATCLFFVFAALIEFAYVNVLCRKKRRRFSTISGLVHVKEFGIARPSDACQEDEIESRCMLFPCCRNVSGLDRARVVDKVSRVVFPLVFILFNIFYWIFYFILAPEPTGL